MIIIIKIIIITEHEKRANNKEKDAACSAIEIRNINLIDPLYFTFLSMTFIC